MGSALRLPFAHLNLRHNPFGEPSESAWAALAVVDVPELRPGDPVQFIGDCGHGKTTHLRALQRRHPEAAFARLYEEMARCAIPKRGVFLLDEAQWLGPRLLRRLVDSGLSIAFGTHDDLTPAARRPLRTVRVDVVDKSHLKEIVARRIEWARRAPGPVPVVRDEVLETLMARHGRNVRAMIGCLYEAVQRMEEPGHVEV
jgi:hypothetical protein